jgi:hypothetical protein
MKHAIAWLAFLGLISPALAYDGEAYKAARDNWHDQLKQDRQDWKDAGKPDPKPDKPAKPNKADF